MAFWQAQLRLFKPASRPVAVVWALMVIVPIGIVAGLDASGTLHPHVHGFWPFAGLTVLAVIGLSLPVMAAVRQENVRWNAIPSCDACGRKMASDEVRVSLFSRLRYYRCDCARRGSS